MDAFILSAVRTPIGKFLGELSDLSAIQLGAVAVSEALKRVQIPAQQFDEVILGNVLQAGVGQAPARQVALAAGLPVSVPAYAVNKVCGSGLKAIMLAAQSIRAGDNNLVIAGGMESMSNAPYLLPNARKGFKYGDQKAVDALNRDGLWCPYENCSMGDTAENTASQCGVSRMDQDQFSAESHRRAAAAWERGDFTDEVVPLTVGSGAKAKTVSKDEGVRPETTAEGLAKLRPAFKSENGTVTAGNASQISDGAAAVVVASRHAIEQSQGQLQPLARIVAYHTSGLHPRELFLAPISAVRGVLAKANLSVADIDLFELNEAFAVQLVACSRELKLDPAKVNVNGGAVALGHPIGASGARVLVTLVHALRKRKLKRGIASLCLGGGNAVAMVIEI